MMGEMDSELFGYLEVKGRHYDIVYSSSSLAKGFFPDAHIQMRNKIRIDQGIAMAINWPKYSSEIK